MTDDGSRLWVTGFESDRLHVLDGADGRTVRSIDLPWGSGPYSVALSPPDAGRQQWALVTLHRAASLAAVNTATYEVVLLAPVYKSPFGIAFTEDGDSAWVTHLFVDGEHPHLTRVDFSGRLPVVGSHFNGFAATPQMSANLSADDAVRNVAEGGYLNFRGHPAQLPSGTGKNQIWIPTQYHNQSENRPSPDSAIQATIRKLELDTRTLSNVDKVILTAKQVHNPTAGNNNPQWQGYGWDAGVSGLVDIGFAGQPGAGPTAILVAEQSDDVIVVPWDTPPFKSADSPAAPGLSEVRVGARPLGIAISTRAQAAWVYNSLSLDVSQLDLATDPPREVRRIGLGGPHPDEPLGDGRLLAGARLFYTSADPRISSNEKVACASCHINAEHDGRTWSFHNLPAGTAGQGHGPRSTPSLLGLALSFAAGDRDADHGWGQLHHSGDRDEVQDFEHTFAGAQMGGTGFLGTGRQAELGAPNGGRSADLDAMAAFVESLPAPARSPARATGARAGGNASASLTASSVRGATFFTGAGEGSADAACAACHVPETGFTDRLFHDVGARRASEERELNDAARRDGCLWCVNTPSLVGMFASHPYDGLYRWAETVTGVIEDFQNPDRPAPHGQPNGLTGRQVRDLAALLESIDGSLTAGDVRGARDTAPPRIVRVAPTSLTRIEVWFDETVDADTAADGARWVLTDLASGARVPIEDAVWDGQNGDRVSLYTHMTATAMGHRYSLGPGPGILDRADDASLGEANAIDHSDPANTHEFSLGERLTVTLGASGYENLSVPVHDMSPVGPSLATWAHDRVQAVFQSSGGALVPGFVRFDWQEAFAAATGVSQSEDLLDASFSLEAMAGDSHTLELRRTLQSWADRPGGQDWDQNPVGGVTWRDHSHPDGSWRGAGASALGGTGSSRTDYNAAWDLSESVDAVVSMPYVNGRVDVRGDGITDAYRFWFANPDVDYGHAMRLRMESPRVPFAAFHAAEEELGLHGPVLSITYRLPVAVGPVPVHSVWLPRAMNE